MASGATADGPGPAQAVRPGEPGEPGSDHDRVELVGGEVLTNGAVDHVTQMSTLARARQAGTRDIGPGRRPRTSTYDIQVLSFSNVRFTSLVIGFTCRWVIPFSRRAAIRSRT